MGTVCEVELCAAPDQAERALAAILAEVERLERRYSRYRSDSLLAEINRVAAGGGSIEVDLETQSLLDYAQACYEQSEGLFDITSGILRRAWCFDSGQAPSEKQIQSLLPKIGWDKVRWRPPRLSFSIPGMELDLGGIVKEYAVDRAAALAINCGVRSGMVNLGGDVKILGPRPDGRPWRVGIRHPRRAGLLTALQVREGAIASSGDYARCMIVNGQRFGHILNPKTGWPVQHLAAVTVLGELCTVAGSAATIAILKEAQGPDWLKALGLPHLWISVSGEIGGAI
ncbi:FAD:protein FMN transferase [Methylothermus subterraneus]